jgi:hypothetical protein
MEGFDFQSTSFHPIDGDTSSSEEDEEESSDSEDENGVTGIVPQAKNKPLRFKKIVQKEELLPE